MQALLQKLGKSDLTVEDAKEHSAEFAKMIAGGVYNPFDPLIADLSMYAQVKIQDYNNSSPLNVEKRKALIKGILGGSGEQICVEPPFACDYGINITVGENFYANYGCCLLDGGGITIGNDVMFGPGVHIYTVHHPIGAISRYEGWELANGVKIGDRVWIGGRTIINPGITIGSDVVIGSGSIVTKDVPSNTLVAGNPARIIRYIDNSEETAKYLSRRTAKAVCRGLQHKELKVDTNIIPWSMAFLSLAVLFVVMMK